MISSEEQLSKLLDDYSRNHHRCFMAEMFLNETRTEYILCFRPMDTKSDSPDRYACQYLRLKTEDADLAAQTNQLSISICEMLDKELIKLGQSQ
jgi:hypothetical protein